VVWVLAGAALAAGAPGAAQGDGSAPAEACVLLPGRTSTGWERQDRRSLGAAFAAAGVPHRIVAAAGSGRRQRAQARSCLAGGAEVLVLAHVDEESGRAVGGLAAAGGAALVAYGRLTPGGSASYFVSSDAVLAGRLMAEGVVAALAARRAGAGRRVVAQLTGPGTESQTPLLLAGSDAVLARAARAKTVVVGQTLAATGGSTGAALVAARRLVAGPKRADAVIAADDALAGAVVAALQERGHAPIPLAGRGATVQGLRNVLAGRQTGTVYASPKLQASAAARVVASLLAGRAVQTNGSTADGTRRVRSVLLRPVWITRANYAAVFAEGVYTRSEICGGAYARYCR
jgi:D-xylose transport system substrate-binding protein